MTDLIEQMKASLVGVTDGPWYVSPALAVQDEHGNTIALVRAKVERVFIAAARTLLPEAIKEIEELRSRAEAAEAKLAKAVEGLKFYDPNSHAHPNEGPWGANSVDFGRRARAALAEIGEIK